MRWGEAAVLFQPSIRTLLVKVMITPSASSSTPVIWAVVIHIRCISTMHSVKGAFKSRDRLINRLDSTGITSADLSTKRKDAIMVVVNICPDRHVSRNLFKQLILTLL